MELIQAANLGVAGVLAGAFITLNLYLVRTTIPSMIDQFRQEMALERSAHSAHTEALVNRMDRIESKVDGLRANSHDPAMPTLRPQRRIEPS